MNLTQVPISMIDTVAGDADKVLTSNGSTLSWSSNRIAKAWVSFDGTPGAPTIRASYNVSSITKNGTGDFTLNFATPMADANYCASGICAAGGVFNYSSGTVPYISGPQATPTTTQFRFGTGKGAYATENGLRADYTYTYIQVFGN